MVEHWKKHRKEFPEFKNSKEYADAAEKFVTNPPPDTLSRIRSKDGATLFYNPKTNIFAVQDNDEVPRTMFRPRDGMNYWNRQIKEEKV